MMSMMLGVLVVLIAAGSSFAGPLDPPGATKALTCSACHGLNGLSASNMMPILAGIEPAYFKKAIEDYATGKRLSPEMEPYAKAVKVLGVDELAGYFAAQKKEPTPIRADAAAAERGKAAAAQCVVCHGADGRGDPAKLIPDLRGQPPGYLRSQMLLFKTDKRSPGDPILKALKTLMATIPDPTIDDLAAYFSSVR